MWPGVMPSGTPCGKCMDMVLSSLVGQGMDSGQDDAQA
jgi:hypothetical protein